MLFLLLFAIDLDEAAEVKEVLPGKTQIIHIRDWHLLPEPTFAYDAAHQGLMTCLMGADVNTG